MKYLPLLHAVIYGDCRTFFLSLSSEQRKDALNFIKSQNLEALVLSPLSKILSEQERNVLQNGAQNMIARALVHEYRLKELCQLFESNRIRHCRIKGTDLAYRIYPNPAMRPFSDWDILFHPEDFEKAYSLLTKRNWIPIYESTKLSSGNHLTPLRKEYFLLEPHFLPSGFVEMNPIDIWSEIHPGPCNSFHCVLSPELNLLMLTRHTAGNYYKHTSLHRLLLDTAFLLKREPMNWNKVHELADRWKLPYPDDLLGAWHEFFPEEIRKEMSPDPENCRLIRTIFSGAVKESPRSWQLVLQDNIFTIHWIKQRFAKLHPALLRHKYQDYTTPYSRILIRDLWIKVNFFLRHILRPNFEIQQHLAAVRKIENSGKNKKRRHSSEKRHDRPAQITE